MITENDINTYLRSKWETDVVSEPAMFEGTTIPDNNKKFPALTTFLNQDKADTQPVAMHNSAHIEETHFSIKTVAQSLADLTLVDNQIYKWLPTKIISGGYWEMNGPIDRSKEKERAPEHMLRGREIKWTTNLTGL